MKFATSLHLIPLWLAFYSVACTAAMLHWASRRGRTPHAYKWGLPIYVIAFSLPTILLVVPTTLLVVKNSDIGPAAAFFAAACILGQIFPMFATHGYWAMWRHQSWGRIITLRAAAFHETQMRRVRHAAPPQVAS
jgi:hypothetical protein